MDDGALDNNPMVDREALAALHEAAFRWALLQSDFDRAQAEDLMQDAYLLVLDGRARFDGRSQLKTWLFGVVHGLAQNRHRRARNRLRLLTRFAAQQPVPEEPSADEDGDAATGRRRQALRSAIAALPARQRDVLALVLYGEFSLAETAEVLGLSLGTVRTHYHRAKAAVANRLDPTAGASDD